MRPDEVLKLLEPGTLLGGALFRSMLAQAEPPLRLPAGFRLGPFAIRSEIGRGGMGVVYLAERVDGEFHQQVAIKCIANTGNETLLASFRRERQVLSELKHPHIALFLDAGSTELPVDQRGHAEPDVAQPTTCLLLSWFAMEMIDGRHFDEYLAQVQPDLPTTLAIVQQIASALSAAHGRLLVHRDVKPSNVLIDRNGMAKLLDFGIAGLSDGSVAQAYSPAWASPEQLSLAPCGPASDQFQLGRLLAMALSIGKDKSVGVGEPRRTELRAIVAKSCAPSPESRYGSVADFSADLRRWQDNLPVQAMGSGLMYSLRCAVRRHPWTSATGATLAVLAMAGLVWFNAQLQSQRDIARAQAERSEATRNYLLSLFQDGDPTRGTDPDLTARELIQSGVARIQSDRSLHQDVRQELIGLLVEIQLRLGETDTAKRLLSGVDLDAIDASTARMWRARVASIEGKPAIAHAELVEQYEQYPSDRVGVLLARAELDIGEIERSERRLLALLEGDRLEPALRSSALLSLGVLQTRTARPLDAIASNRQAIVQSASATPAVSPVPAYINIALAEIDLARFDSALENLTRAEQQLKTFPNQRNHFLILQNRGMALYRKGEIAQAEQVWRTLLERSEGGVNPGIEAATVHNLAAIADARDDAVLTIELSARAQRLRQQLGDPVAALSSMINVAAKLSAIGLHEQAISIGEHALADADKLTRPDLAARAELQIVQSRCRIDADQCIGRMQALTLRFLQQNNLVKALESIERLVAIGHFVGRQTDALTHAHALTLRMEPALIGNADAARTLLETRRWIEALQQPDGSTRTGHWRDMERLAGERPQRRLVLAQRLWGQGRLALAAQLLVSSRAQREDYWRLKSAVASAQQQGHISEEALAEMRNVQARALAALQL